MKTLLLCGLVAGVFITTPVFAQSSTNSDQTTAIDNQKADFAQKIQAKIDKENQSYENKKNALQDKYKDNPNKLNQELDRLSIEHKKKLEELDNKLKTKEDKLDHEKSNT